MRRTFGLVLLSFFALQLPVSEATEHKKWALLVFINGFNNLDPFSYKDLNEMETVGSTGDIHVVAQWASLQRRDVNRVYVKADQDPLNVTSPVVQRLGQVDMGDYRNLVEFVKWAAEHYPADHYFVDVWNHGSGWHKRASGQIVRDISNDDLSGNSISTEQLGRALREISGAIGKKVAIYGSDACLMGMAEIAAELKDSVDVYLGSQHLEPGDGWPYGKFLTEWSRMSDPGPEDVAKSLIQVYGQEFPGRSEITLSAYRMSRYPAVASAVRAMAGALTELPREQAQSAQTLARSTTEFFYSDYRDLGELAQKLAESELGPQVRATAATARRELGDFVFANHASSDLPRASGISVWIPQSQLSYLEYADRYGGLGFHADTDWRRVAELLAAPQ